MVVFIDKNNEPNIIQTEEIISQIYSVLLKVKTDIKSEDIFNQALKILNKECSSKYVYSPILVDICIVKVLQYHNLNTAALLYINSNINDNVIGLLDLQSDSISNIIRS